MVGYGNCDVDKREDEMAGVRRVTRSILRYVYPLYVIAIILQVYFAGEGIFGGGDSSIEDANSLNLHRDFGWFISQPIALLLLLVVQSILPEAGRWVAALHPVNAFVILGIGYLSWSFLRGEALASAAVAEEASPAAAL